MPKKERKKKDKKAKKKVVKFKNVQQNIVAPQSEGYFANYYTPPTIRSRDYSEPRIISSYNNVDSFGLESQYPEVASDQFIIQIPRPQIEPIRIRNIGRMEYNSARDVVMSPQQKEKLPAQEPDPEPAPIKKPRGAYKKKKIIVVAPEE